MRGMLRVAWLMSAVLGLIPALLAGGGATSSPATRPSAADLDAFRAEFSDDALICAGRVVVPSPQANPDTPAAVSKRLDAWRRWWRGSQ